MEKSRKRKPAQQRWIKDLSDEDIENRVRILGSIVDITSVQDQENQENQTYVVLDDGTGRFQVISNQPITLELGAQIRVFGVVRKTGQNELVIEAEIIQDMKDLDMSLYKRVQEVRQRFESSFKNP
jgi:aspartyl/asparaginyl-tRNA synthetase